MLVNFVVAVVAPALAPGVVSDIKSHVPDENFGNELHVFADVH
jgi:hypothetical protein